MKFITLKKYALAATALVLVSGCAPTIATHGNMLKDYQISSVQVGTDTQSDILRKLGSPTAKAPFDDKIWYYMGQETAKHGVLDPKITKEEDYEVVFNDQGTVTTFQNVTHNAKTSPSPVTKRRRRATRSLSLNNSLAIWAALTVPQKPARRVARTRGMVGIWDLNLIELNNWRFFQFRRNGIFPLVS